MTKLSQRKTKLSFVTDSELRYRGKLRSIVIEVENGFHASTRLAGTRQRYGFSFEWLFKHAADLHAQQERMRRRTARAINRLERRKARF